MSHPELSEPELKHLEAAWQLAQEYRLRFEGNRAESDPAPPAVYDPAQQMVVGGVWTGPEAINSRFESAIAVLGPFHILEPLDQWTAVGREGRLYSFFGDGPLEFTGIDRYAQIIDDLTFYDRVLIASATERILKPGEQIVEQQWFIHRRHLPGLRRRSPSAFSHPYALEVKLHFGPIGTVFTVSTAGIPRLDDFTRIY